MHGDLRESRRVRRMYDFLDKGLRAHVKGRRSVRR
jgi:hypothetical protein